MPPAAPGLGAFSREPAPTGVPLMRSAASSESPRFFLERSRQKINPMTPSAMAPPTPTTTPMTTFLFDSERPESSELELESSLRPGALVASPAALVLTEVELIVVGTGVPLIVCTVVTTTTWEVVLGFEVVVALVFVGPVVVASLVVASLVVVAEVDDGSSVVVVSELDDEEVDVGVVSDSEVEEVEVDSSEVVVGVSDSEDEEEVVSEVDSEDSEEDVAEGAELSDVTRLPISEKALCPDVTATRDKEYSKNERLARRMMASSLLMNSWRMIKNARVKVRDEESGGFGVYESYVVQGSLFVSPTVPRDERTTDEGISHGNSEDSLGLEK